jgi:CRISPR/Cas system-associated exonuclease Cas4 (RecB family)
MEYLKRTLRAADEYISASRVNTYVGCPRKYWFSYIDKAEKESFPAALMFGSAAHEVIATIYERIKNKTRLPSNTTAELQQITDLAYDKELERANNESDRILYPLKPGMATADEMRRKLTNVIQTWFDSTEMPDEVISTETTFRAEITDPKTGEIRKKQLLGIVDALTKRNGTTILEEHKTSARKWTNADWDEALQSTLYLAAYPEITTMRFNILIKTKIPNLQTAITTRTPDEKKDGIYTISRVMDAIEAGIFYPIKSWRCGGCPYYRKCRDGYAANA